MFALFILMIRRKKKGCGGEVLNISGKNLSAEDDLFRRPA